ncbi:hypothetical protein NC651_001416 [Populus alba x Populus x berolinensis]|nr:hypothetical protein NC651_001416 [Populus alba x Populus x berolinensis]
MGFSYFSYNQDHDDQEKEDVPLFSESDNKHVDERRDKLGIDFFKLNPLSLIMNHDGGGGDNEGPKKIDWGYLEELIDQLLDEFEIAMDMSIIMNNGQRNFIIKVHDDDDMECHSDIKKLGYDFKGDVDVHGLHEVQVGQSEEQYICYQNDFIFYFFYPQVDSSSILPGHRLLLWGCI